jgi:hypothetical protein
MITKQIPKPSKYTPKGVVAVEKKYWKLFMQKQKGSLEKTEIMSFLQQHVSKSAVIILRMITKRLKSFFMRFMSLGVFLMKKERRSFLIP